MKDNNIRNIIAPPELSLNEDEINRVVVQSWMRRVFRLGQKMFGYLYGCTLGLCMGWVFFGFVRLLRHFSGALFHSCNNIYALRSNMVRLFIVFQ